MALYAISDLHLSLAFDKKMDKFGDNWVGHDEKIRYNWLNTVCDSDTVIISGDISWAMHMTDAKPDLDFIHDLPGRKILNKGNHDYWWGSTSNLNFLYDDMFFLKNDYAVYEDKAICGSRGWLCPNDKYFTQHDIKIYKRELGRVRLSIEKAKKAGFKDIVLITHFPPTNDRKEPSGFTDIINEYNIKMVIYGHLHGENSFYTSLTGESEGAFYCLTSADFLNFKPIRIF